MDEHDFIEALSTRPIEGAQLLRKLKQASVGGTVVDAVRKNAVPLAAAIAGGGMLAGMQYGATRPGKDGLSADQRLSRAVLKFTEERMAKAKAENREPGLGEDLAHATAKAHGGYADAFSRHPKAGAALSVPTGLMLGWQLAKRLQR